MGKAEPIYGALPNQWKMATINELIEEEKANLQTGPFGTMLHASAYKPTGVPVVAVQHIGDNRLIHTDMPRVDDDTYRRLIRYRLQSGDIIFGRKGSVERRALIGAGEEGWLQGSDCIRLRLNPSEIEPRFISYVLGTRAFQSWILQHAHGATMPSLNQEILGRVPLPIPPLPEQYAIAGILGALDDKIELNRRMNRTLESMARAMFRKTMKDEEEQGSILEFANLLSGGTPSTAEESYWNGNIEWVSAKDVSNASGVFLLDTEKKITQEGIDNSATKLLPAKTVIVTARGIVGAHCMLGKPMTMNQTNYGLKAKEGIGDYFVYFTLSEMVEQLKQQSYGTIFDTITTKTFQNALCAQPSVNVVQKFEEQVTPMMNAILNNAKESRTLASLRDTLLPKLMRGEVRVMVKDAEEEL